jgi:PAS domain S-box-containing protein
MGHDDFNNPAADSTYSQRAEELRESEERFRRISAITSDIAYSCHTEEDGRFSIDWMTGAVDRITGYSSEEIKAKSCWRFSVVEEDLVLFDENVIGLAPGSKSSCELRIRHKNGSIVWISSFAECVSDPHTPRRLLLYGGLVDITECKCKEEALKESEQRFSAIFENAADGILLADIKTYKFYMGNKQICEALGYSAEEIKNINVMDIHPAKDLPYVLDQFKKLASNKFRVAKDIPVKRKDGSVYYADISAFPILLMERTYLLGIFRDITERECAEKKIRESEERFKAQYHGSPTPTFTWQRKGQDFVLVDYNNAAHVVTNGQVVQFVGKTAHEMYKNQQHILQDLRVCFAEKTVIRKELQSRHFMPGRHLVTTYAFVPPDLIMVHVEDITERKRANEALEQSEARYRLLAENASDIIFTMDKDLCFTYISPSIERIRGYTVEEAMSQAPEEALTPASLEVAMKAFAEELEIETRETKNLWRTRTLELEETCKDGSTIWTESSFSPLRDEENKLAGFLGITRDITERKRIEEEKKRLEYQLVRVQKIEAIGTLAGGIAHDFNNLLTGILGNVSLVLMKMEESNPFRERLKNIEDYVQRGSDLTKQLLGFARGGKYEVKSTDLGEFIKKSSEMFGRTKKEIRIHYKIQNGLWAAEVDRGQMGQVLLNLFVNAWQAMPGGGNLYLSVENVEFDDIDVSPYNLRPGKFVKVTVTDTGIGMSEAIKRRIFDPFFTTKERDRGTGLGLASVYGIIKNHGGFINVESQEGQGASFMFYLPASEKAPIGDGDTTKDDIHMGSETILLIDDESMILDIGSKMLEGLNYKVITAIGGKQGLQIYEKDRGQIDLVILDMIMPDFSGKETFHALVRINPSVRVLLSSGYSLDDQAREIMQVGCKGFIQKPFTMMELSKKIRGVLDEGGS